MDLVQDTAVFKICLQFKLLAVQILVCTVYCVTIQDGREVTVHLLNLT